MVLITQRLACHAAPLCTRYVHLSLSGYTHHFMRVHRWPLTLLESIGRCRSGSTTIVLKTWRKKSLYVSSGN